MFHVLRSSQKVMRVFDCEIVMSSGMKKQTAQGQIRFCRAVYRSRLRVVFLTCRVARIPTFGIVIDLHNR